MTNAGIPRGSGMPVRRLGDVALAVGGMLALASSMGIGRFVYTPILPAMAAALALSKTGAGLIASANFMGYLAGALLTASPWLSRSRRAWFLAALVLGSAATAGMGLADSMAVFLMLRFLGGMASAFVLVLGSALIIEPRWALIALVPAAVVLVVRRPRLLVLGAVAAAGVLGLIMARRQYHARFFADAAWPVRFDDLHAAGLFVVVLVVAGSLGSNEVGAAPPPDLEQTSGLDQVT